MKIAIWWNIPCKSIVPVARELANNNNDVAFISQENLSESRKNIGWEIPVFGKVKRIILPDKNWKMTVENLVLMGDFDIHIFNGVYYFQKIRYAIDYSRKYSIPFGIITEAYSNPYTGCKRVLKQIFTRIVTPLRVFRRVKKAKFVLSSSGNNIQPFLNLGWRKNQFFPFGYFPENMGLKLNSNSNPIPQLLCTGLINRNKGHHLLVEALHVIKTKGIVFKCIITGSGPEELKIKKLVRTLNLIDEVEILGVISDSELNLIKARTDLFVAPGIEEPWGIRINEALLAHTPVISSDKIGACELILKSGAGRVFKSGNVSSLVKVLVDQLEDHSLNISKEKAERFSSKITPQAASLYLENVIKYTLYGIGNRPCPPWV